MLDWDGDGKDTWKDDYVYHEVFNTKKSGQSLAGCRGSTGGGKSVRLALIVFVLWKLLNIIADAMY